MCWDLRPSHVVQVNECVCVRLFKRDMKVRIRKYRIPEKGDGIVIPGCISNEIYGRKKKQERYGRGSKPLYLPPWYIPRRPHHCSGEEQNIKTCCIFDCKSKPGEQTGDKQFSATPLPLPDSEQEERAEEDRRQGNVVISRASVASDQRH